MVYAGGELGIINPVSMYKLVNLESVIALPFSLYWSLARSYILIC